ncbi:ArnT family glycosyltransferase [Candidatus Margulisiibacteriota bacterium]
MENGNSKSKFDRMGLLIALFGFLWIFLLSFHFPWMWNDDIIYIREAARGFNFPEIGNIANEIFLPLDHVFLPRLVFVYLYKLIYFIFGYKAFYFHLAKSIMCGFLLYYYYKIAKIFLGGKSGLAACAILLFCSQFIFTSIWIAEPITLAFVLQFAFIYYLLSFNKNKAVKYILLFLTFILAIFSKENSFVLMPLFSYYFLFYKKGLEKLFAFIPILLFIFYRFFIPIRDLYFSPKIILTNILYFSQVFNKYYTLIPMLLVLIYIIYYLHTKYKEKTLFQFENNIFLIVWFICGSIILLIGHYPDPRYVVEIYPVFFLLAILSWQWLIKSAFCKRTKKIVNIILLLMGIYIFIVNAYGIVKIEIGWGSVLKSFNAITNIINKEYPGSLLMYYSDTDDFYSAFNRFKPLRIKDTVPPLKQVPKNEKFTSILFVSYPKSISNHSNDYELDKYDKLFTVKKFIYSFDVYKIK